MFIKYTKDGLPIVKNTLKYYDCNNQKNYSTLCHSCKLPGKTNNIYPFRYNYKNIDKGLMDLDFCLNCKANLLTENYIQMLIL